MLDADTETGDAVRVAMSDRDRAYMESPVGATDIMSDQLLTYRQGQLVILDELIAEYAAIGRTLHGAIRRRYWIRVMVGRHERALAAR